MDPQLSWLEQVTHNDKVIGSNPIWSTKKTRLLNGFSLYIKYCYAGGTKAYELNHPAAVNADWHAATEAHPAGFAGVAKFTEPSAA